MQTSAARVYPVPALIAVEEKDITLKETYTIPTASELKQLDNIALRYSLF